MLPQTTQATSTEVEGDITVEVTGTNGQGIPLTDSTTDDQEKQTADTTAEEAQPEKAVSETGTEPERSAPRSERRMEKLIDNLKSKTDEVSELRKQMESLKSPPAPRSEPQLPPWVQPEQQSEITWDQYQAQVADTARNLVKTELTAFQSKVLQYEGFKEDLSAVESRYPILNPDSENYDKEKAKTVAELYQKASTSDPDLRLGKFVDSIMSFHQAGQESGKQELKSSVIKQEAEAAVTPTPNGSLPNSQEKEWESMNLQQKEAWMRANGFWDQ